MSVSYIERDGQRFALVPADQYERMLDDLDDLADIRAYDERKSTPPEDMIPAAIVDRLIAGESPIRVWREHRGLSATALAQQVDIAPPYLSQLEHGHRHASQAVLRRLADALKVDVDDLIGRTGDEVQQDSGDSPLN